LLIANCAQRFRVFSRISRLNNGKTRWRVRVSGGTHWWVSSQQGMEDILPLSESMEKHTSVPKKDRLAPVRPKAVEDIAIWEGNYTPDIYIVGTIGGQL
jgi:hypothetical protein